MDMGVLRNVIRAILKEGRGSYGLFQAIKAIPGYRMQDVSLGARGDTVAWFYSEDDGHLYEVIINRVEGAIYPIPDHLRPKKNENEPFTSDQIADHIKKHLGNLLYGITLSRDNPKYYDFRLVFDPRVVSKEKFIEALNTKVMVTPYTFSILEDHKPSQVVLRYRKS